MKEIQITERHVQAIWYDRDLRPARLSTQDGQDVRVIHPGEWNNASGPDFRGAVLEIGPSRRHLVGDVEVHLSPADWDAHGHGSDSEYQNVIAHVTWRDGKPPRTLADGVISIVLGRFLASDIGFSPESIDLGAYPSGRNPAEKRPCQERIGHDPDLAKCVLTHAGTWRLKAKAERLSGLLKTENRQQVFYTEVMNALGYGKNSSGFRAVARAVPYATVMSEPENAAAAFCTAGTFVEWIADRVRPANSPMSRLAAAARLFTETDIMSLAAIRDVMPSSCRRMLSVLTSGGHIGRGRAAAIIANVIVPFALATGSIQEVPSWLPPEDISAPVRRVASRIFGGDHNPKAWYATNGLMVQGLIQVDREWCARLHPVCEGCGTGGEMIYYHA